MSSESKVSHQTQIYIQCRKYLESQSNFHPSEFFETTFTRGLCFALTSLWLVAKSRGKTDTFFKEIEMILNWDGSMEALKKNNSALKQLFDQLINNFIWLKGESSLLDIYPSQLELSVNALGNKLKLKREFRLSGLFTFEELRTILEKVLNENKMIEVTTSRHDLGIFTNTEIVEGKETKTFSFYDSNSGKEKKFLSIESLAEEIRNSGFTELKHDSKNMPISFSVFDWEDKKASSEIKSFENLYESIYKSDPKFLNRVSWDKHNLLTFACFSGDLDLLRFCLKYNMDPNARGGRKNNLALTHAVVSGGVEVLKELVKGGAKVNENENGQYTALYYAIRENRSSAAEILCKSGASLKDPELICTAAMMGNVEMVRVLCEHNADANAIFDDQSPLYYALVNDHIDCARLLLKHGASVYNEVASAIQDSSLYSDKMLSFIFEYVDDINAYDTKTGSSLLHKAVLYEDKKMIKLLCDRGANIHFKNFKGISPMMSAESKEIQDLLKSYDKKAQEAKQEANKTKSEQEATHKISDTKDNGSNSLKPG